MELPAKLTNVERALGAVLLAAALAAAGLEARSPAAAAVRAGAPWATWLALEADGAALPQLFLAVYQPARRALTLAHYPETTPLDGKRTLSKVYAEAKRDGSSEREAARAMADALALPEGVPAPGFHYDRAPAWTDEPPLAAKQWLRHGRLAEGFEGLRMAVEINRMGEDDIVAAYAPAKEEMTEYYDRLMKPHDTDQPVVVTVEILNSTERAGVAKTWTKRLRLRGADVVSSGNAPARARTAVYDRTGRPELAAKVRRMLGCPSAEAVTQIDAKRLVDVTVVVAEDCAQQE